MDGPEVALVGCKRTHSKEMEVQLSELVCGGISNGPSLLPRAEGVLVVFAIVRMAGTGPWLVALRLNFHDCANYPPGSCVSLLD